MHETKAQLYNALSKLRQAHNLIDELSPGIRDDLDLDPILIDMDNAIRSIINAHDNLNVNK